jgi:hypothetical protein
MSMVKTKFGGYLWHNSLRFAVIFLIVALLLLVGCGGGASVATSPTGGNGGSSGGGGSSSGGGTAAGAFTAGRTKYVRTDASVEYYQWINAHWIIYNPITNFFYVTDPGSNHVFVLSASSQKEVAVINIPEAFTIDDTPDHSTLYVGTQIGDVYTIDPVSLRVTHRYQASGIGPGGFSGIQALVMADGQLALAGAQGGIPSVDGYGSIALWNPATNALSVYEKTGSISAGLPLPCGQMMGNIGGFSRTADRMKIILASIDSDDTLCEVDEAGAGVYISTGAGFAQVNFRTSSDGKYIVVPTTTGALPPNNSFAYVYDASTLNQVSQIAVSGDTSTASGFAFSADSKTLYVPNAWIIYAYDLATGKQVGWMPNINVPFFFGGMAEGPAQNPDLQATDSTGLLVGPMEEGVGFIDTTTMQTGAVGSQFPNAYVNPETGSTAGGTQVQITEPAPFGKLSAVYFGSHRATNESGVSGPDTHGQYGSISATTPAGNAGPADVYVFTADGGMQLMPEGFSYGPTIVEITPNMSTAEGGGTGIIYGYGFGPVGSGGSVPIPNFALSRIKTSVPSSLQVAVDGKPVQITEFAPYAYPQDSPPFPLQAIVYTIPPGTGTADVTVTSSSGSTTAHSALSYLPAIQKFPLLGASLVQGIYDPHRDLYYFTDGQEIRVFSRTQGAWQAPIPIPAPAGAKERLWGLSLSPDGTKLAVADNSAQVIYLLNPSNPTAVQTFPVPTMPAHAGIITNACGVAVSDAGIVYYAATVLGGTGFDQFFKLDTSTATVTAVLNTPGPGTPALDVYLRTYITSDNSLVFFNSDGDVFSVDTATDTASHASVDQGCCYGDYDLTLSEDSSRLEATDYFYDSALAAESGYAMNDREILNIGYVYGAKLNTDGSLLFQPSSNGIDVFDGHLGNLLNRISLPVALSVNYDALVSDGKDNVLIAITGENGDGIAVIDLSSILGPAPLPYSNEGSRVKHPASVPAESRAQTGQASEKSTSRSLHNRVPHLTKSRRSRAVEHF